jgi:hypothetical protein
MEPADSGFREQLEERILTYQGQRERIRTKLVELNHDLLDIERRLEAAEELYTREFGLQPPGSKGRRSGRKRMPRAADQQSWREAIVSVLCARGPLHVNDIWQGLLDSGFQTQSRDPIRSIVAIAVRDPQIYRTAPNTYAVSGGNSDAAQTSLDGRDAAVQAQGGSE